MSKEKVVITIKNEELPISKCRQFNKKWYKIGDINILNSGDCYFINDKYYREETKNIVYNHSINKYVLKDDSIIKGIVNIENENIIFGYFNYDKKHAVIVLENGNKYYLLDESCLINNRTYREVLSTGEYTHISLVSAISFNKLTYPEPEYKTSLPYDSKGILDKYLQLYDDYTPEISKNVNSYHSILGDLTFGLEFETSKGTIPERIIEKYGIIPLRDGSIEGIEYVTVPLQGKKGLQYIIDITKILNERTEYNDKCSLHQHIGNIPRTKEFILSFFKLTCAIQDDIFKMFPLYKKYNFGIKNKNYSKPYPIYELLSQMDPEINCRNIDDNFNVLYKYLSQGYDFKEVGNDLNNIINHPSDPQGNQKWLIKTRYYFHNMIPLIFGNKKTIEFRIHTPTYNINKIINFIFINSIIVNYAIKYQKEILENRNFLSKKTLSNIIEEYLYSLKCKDLNKIHESLLIYIDLRIKRTEQQNKNGNILGNEKGITFNNIINWENVKSNKNNNDLHPLYYSISDIHSEILNSVQNFKTKPVSYYDKKYTNVSQEIKTNNF